MCCKKIKGTVSGDDVSLVFADKLLLVGHTDKGVSYLEEKASETGDGIDVGVEYIMITAARSCCWIWVSQIICWSMNGVAG